MLISFFSALRAKNKPLFWFGWINVLTWILAAVMYLLDDTVIMGINAWIKPMKFAISITIYSWTFAWLLHYLPDQKRKNFITWGIILCMSVENGLIYMQAFRGVTSHFNVHTAFDGIVFSTMGLFILINSILVLYTFILFFSKKIALEPTLLWAWRIGLLLFFLGGISGGIMSARLAHSVGIADGGPGLPLFNWSTVAGDIRSGFSRHRLGRYIDESIWHMLRTDERSVLSRIAMNVGLATSSIEREFEDALANLEHFGLVEGDEQGALRVRGGLLQAWVERNGVIP